jgi:hydroxyethylthiazole kinase-like uncharacterized protein yjeF
MTMRRLLPARAAVPLHDAAGTRAIEQQAMAVLPPHTLMRRAGAAVARLALAVAPHARRVWIAAGPGNNGGDGIEAAIALRAAGRDTRVTLHGDAARLPEDARDALARALAAGVPVGPVDAAWLDTLDGDDLAIDALLGLGSRRAPEGAIAEAVAALARLRAPLLAVDLPTGLDADRGTAAGSVVMADHTLALLTAKPGLFTAHGRDAAGTVWLDDLDVATHPTAPVARLGAARPALLDRARPHASHKGRFGDLAVVGGADGMTGAALLAARAATMAGAGRVFVQCLGAAPPFDALQPELMLRPGWSAGPGVSSATVVAGCGGGEAVAGVLPRLLSAAPRLLLDADALNAVAGDASLATLLAARAARGAPTVLTPHPLEAARLLATSTAEVQADRLAAARELAARTGAVVVLKGSGTVVATPGGVLSINATGSAALASGGTGDVLAGALGGLWSAGADAGDAAVDLAVAAVAWHGAAAEGLTRGPRPASTLIARMAALR